MCENKYNTHFKMSSVHGPLKLLFVVGHSDKFWYTNAFKIGLIRWAMYVYSQWH